MAVLNRKEDKVQAVLDRLPKQYTHEQFVEMFIKLFSKDWGKIKAAYIKQSQDKEPGTVINMPNPKSYLQQILNAYLDKVKSTSESPKESIEDIAPAKPSKPAKKAVKEAENTEETVEVSSKPAKATTIKKTAKAKVIKEDDSADVVKKAKATPKKKEL